MQIYEVMRIYKGDILFFDMHLMRLKNTLEKSQKNSLRELSLIKNDILSFCKEKNITEGSIKLSMTYSNENNYLLEYLGANPLKESDYEFGIKTLSLKATRENPELKIFNNNLREISNKFIKDNQITEAILVDNQGFITEGSRSNFFLIKENNLYCSPKEKVLPGITSKNVLEIAKNQNIKIIEQATLLSQIENFDAAFISDTPRGVTPVKQLDNKIFDVNNQTLQIILKEFDKRIN